MANLADDIEHFLRQLVWDAGAIEVQRAALAAQFGCAPSQINYVLTTRFTPERGFAVESRRGGGGYIRIARLTIQQGDGLHDLIVNQIGPTLSQDEAFGYIHFLHDHTLIDQREAAIMKAAVTREAISLELPVRDRIRANLLKAMIHAALQFRVDRG